MEDIYFVCFLIATLWVILTFLFGEVLDGIDDMDLDGVTLGHAWSTRSLLMGLLMFGLSGWLISRQTEWHSLSIFGLALGIGTMMATMLEFWCLRPLRRLQSTSIASTDDFIGLEATVMEPIGLGRTGRIMLVHRGMSLTYGAQAISEELTLKRGDLVVVMAIEEGIAKVKPKINQVISVDLAEEKKDLSESSVKK